MEWGAGVAGVAITGMMDRAKNTLAPTVRSEFVEKLIKIIRQHGSITRRKLQHRIQGRYRTQEVNDMLNQAIEAGFIVRTPNGYAAGIAAGNGQRKKAREPAAKLSGNCWRVLAWFFTRGKHPIPYIYIYIYYIYIYIYNNVSKYEGRE